MCHSYWEESVHLFSKKNKDKRVVRNPNHVIYVNEYDADIGLDDLHFDSNHSNNEDFDMSYKLMYRISLCHIHTMQHIHLRFYT